MHVDDLRDLALIKQGKLELRQQRIELATTIERAIDVVDAATRHRPRTLEVTQLAEPVYLIADPVRIEQVFVKLLMNASRFTGPGGYIWLEVDRHRDEVMISVRDNGEGIAAERLPRLFDLYMRRVVPAEGTPLRFAAGLALAAALITMHGGTLAVASDGPGKGSVFTVRLPIATAEVH
jgi:signal transduction histidine kinase